MGQERTETRIGLKAGQQFTLWPYTFQVASGDVVLVVTHESGKKVWSEELSAGRFDLKLDTIGGVVDT